MFEGDAAMIARLLDGRLSGVGRARGVATDSRTVRPGELFVALQGKNFDGHDFVARAFERGAAGAVASKPIPRPPDRFLVLVQDTLHALGELARAWRGRFGYPWFVVTGSCGKTTTKEMLAHVLSARTRVLKAESSYNNAVGVPLTVLRASAEHAAAVVEVGTNYPGDIAALSRIARPNATVVTSVGLAHTEGLGSLQGVAVEKAAALAAVPKDGLCVIPADAPFRDVLEARSRGWVRTFGLGSADVRAEGVELRALAGSRFRVKDVRFELRVPGMHNVRNALAATACALWAGLELEECAGALARFRLPPMRMEFIRLGSVLVLRDCYNANPLSFSAALETFRAARARRKIVVAGDMLELGRASEPLHAQLGRELGLSVDMVIAVGKWGALVAEEARKSGAWAFQAADAVEAAHVLLSVLKTDDAVLVKGSRRLGLERVVDILRKDIAILSASA